MEEEHICRVCRCEGTHDNPLFYPCLCSGSIKYIHQDCLVQWLQHSKKKYCELCNHPFTFSPIYDESMPSTLPKSILLAGALRKIISVTKLSMRYALVFICWLIMVPFLTTRIWNLYFSTNDASFELDFKSVVTDCFEGAFISASVISIFLGLMALRDYIVSHRILREQVARPIQDDAIEPNNNANPNPNLIINPNHNPIPNNQADDIQFPDFQGWEEEVPRRVGTRNMGDVPSFNHPNPNVNSSQSQSSSQASNLNLPPVLINEESDDDSLDLDEDAEDSDDEGIDGALEDNQPNNNNARQNREENDGGFGLGAAFLDGPHEDVSFEELIGLKGSIFNLFENILWVLMFNAVFLGTFAFFPYAIGDIILKTKPTEFLLENVNLYLFNISGSQNLSSTVNLTLEFAKNITEAETTENSTFYVINRILSIFLGYSVIGLIVVIYLAISLLFHSQERPFNRFLQQSAQFTYLFFKVSIILCAELGLFPLMCGCMIDFITLDVFNATLANRLALFYSAPYAFTFVHWFVGMNYMFQLSSFVQLLRESLRPGVLWFLRNPNDPSFQPLREMIELPAKRHFRRIVVSSVLYSAILLATLWSATQAAEVLLPNLFPLNWFLNDPISELPVDLMAVHFLLPFIFHKINVRETFGKGVKIWVELVSRLLCLSSYLLGKDYQDEIVPGTTVVAVVNNDSVDLFMEREQSEQNTVMVYRPPLFKLRVSILLILLCFSASIGNFLLFFGPALVGRSVFSHFMKGTQVHEIYTYGIGLFILSSLVLVLKIIFSQTAGLNLSNIQIRNHLTSLRSRFVTFSKVCYLFFIVAIVVPFLVGILFDLAIVKPLTTPPNQSLIFFFLQDWCFGAFVVRIFSSLIYLGPDSSWKILIDNISRNGVQNINMSEFTTEFAFPLVGLLLVIILAPYCFCFGILPFFEGYDLVTVTQAARLSYPLFLGLVVLVFLSKLLTEWSAKLQQSIRDERYLIGQKLQNLDRLKRGGEGSSQPALLVGS